MTEAAARILLIEDAPQVAGILVSKLGREGHAVVWKRDRRSALEALEAGPFDLILLSTYLLPARDAWDLLDNIKPRVRAPVLMLLEAEEAPLQDRAVAAGAAGVILKPFKPTQVARIVRDALATAAGASAPADHKPL